MVECGYFIIERNRSQPKGDDGEIGGSSDVSSNRNELPSARKAQAKFAEEEEVGNRKFATIR